MMPFHKLVLQHVAGHAHAIKLPIVPYSAPIEQECDRTGLMLFQGKPEVKQ